MHEIHPALRELLDREHVAYEAVPHHADHTAHQTAWDTHTPSHSFAKTVFVWVDEQMTLAVLPADDRVSEMKLRLSLDAKRVELASESEIAEICADCEPGAAPPFGQFWGLDVVASPALGESEQITFNAGNHRTAVRMRYADWNALATPRIVPLARHD